MCLLRFLCSYPLFENIYLLCDIVRETSFAIHRYLKSGYPEKVYEKALVHRLKRQNIDNKRQIPIEIYDEDGTKLGHYMADLLIEGVLIIELKACKTLTEEHTAQIFGYLRGTRLRHGMLINFGGCKLQVKKLIL